MTSNDRKLKSKPTRRRIVRARGFADFVDGMPLPTVHRWLSRGEVPGAFRIGRTWFVDLDVFLKEVHP